MTGAAGGIGGAAADALAAAGHDVVRTDLPLDVADEGAITELVARTEADRGPIEILVNCAGHIRETPIGRISDEEWDRMLRVHLGGTWHTCRAAGPRMAARGRGSIVNVSSELALCGAELHAHYCAAKGAIVGLTKALALELAPARRARQLGRARRHRHRPPDRHVANAGVRRVAPGAAALDARRRSARPSPSSHRTPPRT